MRGLEAHHDFLTDHARSHWPRRSERNVLSPGAIASYQERGFLGPVDILDSAEVERTRSALDRVIAALDRAAPLLHEIEAGFLREPDRVVCHFLGAWRIEPWLHDLVFHPKICAIAASLLGVERLRLWHDQAFVKPPGHPGVVPWHQDYAYWKRTTPCRHITCNLMLDHATDLSGRLEFVPGSHRGPLTSRIDFAGPRDAILAELTEAQRSSFRPIGIDALPGQATFHDAMTIHGSGANRSNHPRRAIVMNYMAADTVVADDAEPLLRGVPPIPRGALIAGAFFPIVFDAAARTPTDP